MRHEAIFNTHPTVVTINGDNDAFDAAGNPVTLNESLIAAERAKLEAEAPRRNAVLTRAQFKLALLAGGYLDAVEAVMAHPDTPRDLKIMYQDSSTFERLHPALLAMAAQMGYTDEQMDALFGIA